jgi:ketosteroid isomerase-like protein
MDERVLRAKLDRFFEYVGADVDRAEELYHEDAVLEFPQSGERFEGRTAFTEWRRQYPVPRGDARFHIRRVTVREDFTVVELSASYDRGATWMYGVQLLDFRGDKVVRERIYAMDGWEAPEWRAPWRSPEPADPPP